jgi:hypothetical protein
MFSSGTTTLSLPRDQDPVFGLGVFNGSLQGQLGFAGSCILRHQQYVARIPWDVVFPSLVVAAPAEPRVAGDRVNRTWK